MADVTVKAIAKGFYVSNRRVGDVFDVPEGFKGSWFIPCVEGETVVPTSPSFEEPETFRSITNKRRGRPRLSEQG